MAMVKYVVAGQYPSGLWDFYGGADDLRIALDMYELIKRNRADTYVAAALFTRSQWLNGKKRYCYYRTLRDRSDESIPSSLGMWLINQADSGYF